MTNRDMLKCESARWCKRRGRKMTGTYGFDLRQWRIDHAKRFFVGCLLIAVYGAWIAGLLLYNR